jgi:hypothetical protein
MSTLECIAPICKQRVTYSKPLVSSFTPYGSAIVSRLRTLGEIAHTSRWRLALHHGLGHHGRTVRRRIDEPSKTFRTGSCHANLSTWWAYLIGPVTGAVIAVGLAPRAAWAAGCLFAEGTPINRGASVRGRGFDSNTDSNAPRTLANPAEPLRTLDPGRQLQNERWRTVANAGGRCGRQLQNQWSASLAMSTDGSFPSPPASFELGQ